MFVQVVIFGVIFICCLFSLLFVGFFVWLVGYFVFVYVYVVVVIVILFGSFFLHCTFTFSSSDSKSFKILFLLQIIGYIKLDTRLKEKHY